VGNADRVPGSRGRTAPGLVEVQEAIHRLFIAVSGTVLRREDRQKAAELVALLAELHRLPRRGVLVDAAAGKAPVGLLAAELLGFAEVVVIERDRRRIAACREAVSRLSVPARVEVRALDVTDLGGWPTRADLIVALHACGPAADAVVDAGIATQARRLLVVPCCYGSAVPFAARAEELARTAVNVAAPPIRGRLTQAFIDAERVLRLEAAGYEVEPVAFCPPTVTPHNLLLRARLVGEPQAMARAAAEHARLTSPPPT